MPVIGHRPQPSLGVTDWGSCPCGRMRCGCATRAASLPLNWHEGIDRACRTVLTAHVDLDQPWPGRPGTARGGREPSASRPRASSFRRRSIRKLPSVSPWIALPKYQLRTFRPSHSQYRSAVRSAATDPQKWIPGPRDSGSQYPLPGRHKLSKMAVTLGQFHDRPIQSPALRQLMSKMTIEEDAGFTRPFQD